MDAHTPVIGMCGRFVKSCAIVGHLFDTAPIGADAVVLGKVSPLASRARLARLRLRARGRLRAGPGVVVSRGVRIDVPPGGRVTLGRGCELGVGCRIEAAGGEVVLGEGVRVGERAVVVALSRVAVGDGATVGEWASVTDAGPDPADDERPIREQPPAVRPVSIGAGARIGAHAALGPGADVPPGAAVGSYAVVPTPVAPLSSP